MHVEARWRIANCPQRFHGIMTRAVARAGGPASQGAGGREGLGGEEVQEAADFFFRGMGAQDIRTAREEATAGSPLPPISRPRPVGHGGIEAEGPSARVDSRGVLL